MAAAWTTPGGTNLQGNDANRRAGAVPEAYLAVLSGGASTNYLSFTTRAAIILAVEYQGSTNPGTTTEAMAGAASISQDNGKGANTNQQTVDQILSTTTTMAGGVRTVRDLKNVYCQNGFGATTAGADTVLVWFRYA